MRMKLKSIYFLVGSISQDEFQILSMPFSEKSIRKSGSLGIVLSNIGSISQDISIFCHIICKLTKPDLVLLGVARFRFIIDLCPNCNSMQTLLWRLNWRDGVSNHQPHHCLLSRLYRHRSEETSKPRVTGLCEGNSPVTVEFPPHMASNAENVLIGWRHQDNIFVYPTATLSQQAVYSLGSDCHEMGFRTLGHARR